MPPLDLTGVKAKLTRAQEHAQTLDKEIVAWTKRTPYSLRQHVNTEGSRYSLVLHVNEVPQFRRWTLIAADCISNLRACLDQLVFAIAAHESFPDPPRDERQLMFPIADSKARFDDAITKKRRLGCISQPIVTAIESFQPYKRPHKDLPPVLALLRDFNDADKHRLLRLVYGAIQQGEFSLVGDGAKSPPNVKFEAVIGEIEGDAEIVAATCDPPTPNMKFQRISLDLVVSIWHGKRDASGPVGSDRSAVKAVLDILSEEVRSVIYSIAPLVR